MPDEHKLANDAKAQAKDISEAAKTRIAAEAESKADALLDTAADEVQSAANAAEAASEQFDSQSLQAMAAHRLADQIEGVAGQLRSTDINSLITQTSDFARRNPLLFIGGAAALGFAATRFFKARNPQASAYADHDDPWRGTSRAESETLVQSTQSHAVLAEINGGARHG